MRNKIFGSVNATNYYIGHFPITGLDGLKFALAWRGKRDTDIEKKMNYFKHPQKDS